MGAEGRLYHTCIDLPDPCVPDTRGNVRQKVDGKTWELCYVMLVLSHNIRIHPILPALEKLQSSRFAIQPIGLGIRIIDISNSSPPIDICSKTLMMFTFRHLPD